MYMIIHESSVVASSDLEALHDYVRAHLLRKQEIMFLCKEELRSWVEYADGVIYI
jgi:hypothetical protein